MDTLFEVKEEQCPDASENKSKIKLQSPQMKFITDYEEDNTCRPAFFSSNHASTLKFDYIEQDEVITEDHDENNLENNLEMRKSSSSKKLENFIDKSEAFDEQHGSMKKAMTENIIESIKEENIEEEEREELTASTPFRRNESPISDELEQSTHQSCTIKYRLSVKTAKFEENKVINESEEDG